VCERERERERVNKDIYPLLPYVFKIIKY
jgi:hypothetical protein